MQSTAAPALDAIQAHIPSEAVRPASLLAAFAMSESVSPRLTVCVEASLRACAIAGELTTAVRRRAADSGRPRRKVFTRSRGCGARVGANRTAESRHRRRREAVQRTIRLAARNGRDRYPLPRIATWITIGASSHASQRSRRSSSSNGSNRARIDSRL